MNEKITAHPQKEEREKVLKEIRQLENRKKILENKQRNEERRVRTRRLIERGAVLEGIFPLAPDLSGAEVKAFLIALSHLPGGCGIDCKPAKIRGHAQEMLVLQTFVTEETLKKAESWRQLCNHWTNACRVVVLRQLSDI